MDRFTKAVKWVLEAEELLHVIQTENWEIAEKSGPQDIVTRCDRELERLLRQRIQSCFPDDRIVGEEYPEEGHGDVSWYIDPIDGTTNFVNQRSNYAISVGCAVNGQPLFGIVRDVERQRTYTAQKGGGAWLDGKRLHTSAAVQIRDMLLTTPCVTDLFLTGHEKREGFSRLAMDVRAVRSMGSVALELCEVAAGRAELCAAMKSAPWDHNAARLILSEAGGEIRRLDGEKLPLEEQSAFLAGNSLETVKKVLADYLGRRGGVD